eukprot:100073-Rhodomonas_salina.1
MGRPQYFETWYHGVPLFGVPEKCLVSGMRPIHFYPVPGYLDEAPVNSVMQSVCTECTTPALASE